MYCMYDKNGNERVKYIGSIGRRNLDERRIKLIKSIVYIANNTDYFCEYSKMYIRDRDISLKSLTEIVNEIEGKKYTVNTITSKVMYDKKKIETVLGQSIIDDIVYTSQDIGIYEEKVNLMINMKSIDNATRNMFSLSIDMDVVRTTYNGDFIADYKDVILKYSKRVMQIVEEALNSDIEFKGYFNYLTSNSPNMSKEAIRDKERLMQLLKEGICEDKEESKEQYYSNADTEEEMEYSESEDELII